MTAIARTLALFALAFCSTAYSVAQVPPAHVEVRGTGPTNLLLVPCAGCDWRSWEPFMERNARRYTMHAVTLAGLGGSPAAKIAFEKTGTPLFDGYAAGIATYIRWRGLKSVVLVGHSMGAVVALKTAVEHPENISKVVLVDWGATHPKTLDWNLEQRAKRAAERKAEVGGTSAEDFRAQAAKMGQDFIRDAKRAPVYADMFAKVDQGTSAQISYEMQMYDLRPRLRGLKVPVLALYAAEEEPIAEVESRARAVNHGASRLTVQVIPGSGHWIMEDKRAEFDRALADFADRGE